MFHGSLLAFGWRCLALSACAGACLHAGAQAHRCGETSVYTDKPCADARPVDVRPNLLDAGPRFFPSYDPAPAVIPPSAHARKPAGDDRDVWQKQKARDAQHRARTYRP